MLQDFVGGKSSKEIDNKVFDNIYFCYSEYITYVDSSSRRKYSCCSTLFPDIICSVFLVYSSLRGNDSNKSKLDSRGN
jgi:hypothetical protein